ncbi:MAG: hypothetical protein PHY34_02360 [Patescibacteria group bacterium]|nr:hypothetical protein [Patescibacteria group bacterium]MDD5715222.1 hypothetical protein [Patescibacteria group bacterium]
MDTPQTPQPTKPASKALWVVLLILVLAAAGYGVYAYLADQDNENTNQNANTSANTNSSVNASTNTSANTNAAVNTNSTANVNANTNTSTNTNIDTSGWKTYENDTYNYSVQYPTDWSAETVGTELVMDHVDGDAIFSKLECGECVVPTNICEFTLTSATNLPSIEPVVNPIEWIKNQGSYKGDIISEINVNNFTAYITNVAVTPPDENGMQGIGQYILINTDKNELYLEAYLSEGYGSSDCQNEMKQILNTVQIF